MKKYIILIFFSLICFSAFSKPANLHVEKLFDGSFNSNQSVSLIVSKSQEKYFRGCTITDNKALLEKVAKLFEKDLSKASSSQDIITNGTRYRSMIIINNGEEIYVGLSYDSANSCYLFINGPLKAFK